MKALPVVGGAFLFLEDPPRRLVRELPIMLEGLMTRLSMLIGTTDGKIIDDARGIMKR